MKEEYNVADLSKVIAYAESILGNDYTGHGFDHVKRVAGLSQAIIDADELAVDCFVVQAAAYLHDTVDDKVVADVTAASNEVRACLTTAGASEAQTKEIFSIIENLSFSKELLQGAQVVSVEAT
ncbi:MAG: metal-dependent phosphohydrolase, partial [Enterococcus casseliflavus]